MKSEYSFILDNITYSYSSVNNYETCPYSFKLSYIDYKEKMENAFGQFGSLIHKCIEEYLKKNVSVWDLTSYYENSYSSFVTTDFPSYPKNMAESYYQSGLNFFNDFNFDINNYDIMMIEDFVNYKLTNSTIIVKPDAILKEKNSGKIILLDFKTAKLKTNSKDSKQIVDYLKQMYIYCYYLYLGRDINIDEIHLYFIRDNIVKIFPVDKNEMMMSIEWFEKTIEKIKETNDWIANNSKSNKYFCDNICSMRLVCEERLKLI